MRSIVSWSGWVIITGDFLSEPQLIAVAYAIEQALHGRVEPDLATTM